MANFLEDRKNTNVSIPYMEREQKITYYVIHVSVGEINWKVKHRYSDFVTLNELLVLGHGVAKELLPPKKVIGNSDPEFLENRREGLENYLKTLINFLQRAMPQELAHFLKFHEFEVFYILQNLALKFFNEGDVILKQLNSQIDESIGYIFSPLKLHSISCRLKQPCPPIDVPDKRLDFSHVLDFCSQVKYLQIIGSNEELESTNIIPNTLEYDFKAFKKLNAVNMKNVNLSKIKDARVLKNNVQFLSVTNSQVTSVISLTMCDDVHKKLTINIPNDLIWHRLIDLDISNNYLMELDESFKLMPKLEKLNLSNNLLSDVKGITSLPYLSHLYLSNNKFKSVENLHLKLGNITNLDLSDNQITSLTDFSRLLSLECLDLARNCITDIEEARYLSNLPCLETLILTGNPVAGTVDYRTRILERIGIRGSNIYLDNEKPNQKELDTIAVLQALRIVQEGRDPTNSRLSNSR